MSASHHRKLSVYGFDDRKEVRQCGNQFAKNNLMAVAVMVDARDLTLRPDGKSYDVATEAMKDFIREVHPKYKSFEMDQSVKFRDQRVPATMAGTGFLVAKDVICTAHHCVFDGKYKPVDLSSICWIFGWAVEADGTMNTVVKVDQVFKTQAILHSSNQDEEEFSDWAVVLLARSAPYPILTLDTVLPPEDSKLWMMGHPSGLMLKYTEGKVVKGGSSNVAIGAQVAGFQGNSGSPVFTSENKILTGGGDDWAISKEGKIVEFVIDPETGDGEHIQPVHTIIAKLFAFPYEVATIFDVSADADVVPADHFAVRFLGHDSNGTSEYCDTIITNGFHPGMRIIVKTTLNRPDLDHFTIFHRDLPKECSCAVKLDNLTIQYNGVVIGKSRQSRSFKLKGTTGMWLNSPLPLQGNPPMIFVHKC